MSRLILVRHGETVWHKENRYAGRTDVALTSKGVEQAERLACWARGAGLTGVWSSPLSRARLTAQGAAEAANVSLQVDERLVEIDFGRGEGLTGAEMTVAFPFERAAFLQDPVANFLPEGEDPREAAQRGVKALRSIAMASGQGSKTLVVAHSTLLRLVLCSLLEIPLSRYRSVLPSLTNGALTEIELTETTVALICLNVPLPRKDKGD
jgi:probable phosphoglycerate mutase